MSQTNVTFRMDEDLKKTMESICHELGISMTTAFTIFAKKMSREKRIPFDVSIDPFYSENNIKALIESSAQIKNGKTVVKTLDDLEEMTNE